MSIATVLCDLFRGHHYEERDVQVERVKTATLYCRACKHSELAWFARTPEGGWVRVGYNDPRITVPLFGTHGGP